VQSDRARKSNLQPSRVRCCGSRGGKGAELLVVPEAYALTVSASDDDVFDTWISDVGSTPYLHGSNATSLQQVTISRLAKENGLAIASNIFVARDGKNYITQVIFSSDGSVIGYYDKHHLFVTELLHFHAGPFQPTVVDLHGRRLGLIICWEGFYPYVTFDWSQMEQLKREGSETFVWSIGGTSKFHVRTPDKAVGSHYAKTYNVSVVVSDVEKDGQILSSDGNGVPSVVVPLSIPTYTASATTSVATI